MEYLAKVTDGPDAGKYVCTICGKVNGQKNNISVHIESIHFPGTNEYTCESCGSTFPTKMGLYKHRHQKHKQ